MTAPAGTLYRLKTIDVWDTLLRRECHPEFAKLASAAHVFLDPSLALFNRYESAWDLYRARVEQEAAIATQARAAGRDNEHEIIDVLEQWLNTVVGHPVDPRLAVECAKLELKFEFRHSYADPTIRELSAQHPADETLFVSDFPMSAQHLASLLRWHGLADLVPHGVSSSDVGLTARSGKLFEYIGNRYRVHSQNHVHIGDCAVADGSVPRALGIVTIAHKPSAEQAKRAEREKLFHDRPALFRKIKADARETGERLSQEVAAEHRAAFKSGVQAAPLLVGFGLDIAEGAIKDGLEHLYFFSREGEFVLRAFETLFPAGTYAGHALPSSALLDLTRLTTFCSLHEITPAEILRLWNLYSVKTIDALLKALGLDARAFKELVEKHGLTLRESISAPLDDSRINSLFGNPVFVRAIKERVRGDRQALLSWLAAQGLSADGTTTGVVDIGWRGCLQDNLAWLRPSVQFHGRYLGLQSYLNEQADLDKVTAITQTAGTLLPIEMFFGSSMACRNADASCEESIRAFQEGVIAALQVWARYVGMCAVTAKELRESACDIWFDLLDLPRDEFIAAYSTYKKTPVAEPAGPGIGSRLLNVLRRPKIVQIARAPQPHQAPPAPQAAQSSVPSTLRASNDAASARGLKEVAVSSLSKGYKFMRTNF